MTVAKEKKEAELKKPEKKTIWTTEERNNLQTLYGCDILVENGSVWAGCPITELRPS